MKEPRTVESSATHELAVFASSLTFEVIPREVIDKAKLCLLDTIGCCVQGAGLPFVRTLADVTVTEGARGGAAILGTALRTAPSGAALANGTAAHSFQLDEVHAGATLHPGSVVVPAALALAGGRRSGREFLAAMVAAYEVGIRVGVASNGGMFRRGYHNQGTTGCVAAAAAAARVLELDSARTAMALSLAASQAAGLMAVQEGANAKALHSGRAAQSGVYAALLARGGFTGAEDALDAGYGRFFDTLVGEWKPERLCSGLGERWHTLEVGYKLSPASNGSITAMDTLSRIMHEHRLRADDVARIVARVSTNTLHHCGWDFDPAAVKGVLGAQMNLRYGLSVMALDRAATPTQYTMERIRERDIAAFLPKIEVEACEEFDSDPGLRLASRLELTTRDKRTYTGETRYRRGSAENPVSVEQLEDKFLTLTIPVLGERRARASMQLIRTFDDLPCVPEDLASV
jgi:2-methylcitrate dehydratase PrpD